VSRQYDQFAFQVRAAWWWDSGSWRLAHHWHSQRTSNLATGDTALRSHLRGYMRAMFTTTVALCKKLVISNGNDTALMKWMVGGPNISRMVHELEQTDDSHSQCHYVVSTHFQSRFIGHASKVVRSLHEDGNPFLNKNYRLPTARK